MYSYLDIERGIVLFADTEGLFAGQADFLVEAPSLLAWLDLWIAKQDQYPSLAEQAEGDEMSWAGSADVDAEEDLQAKAMGLEKLEDDSHTPIPRM